MQKSYIHRDLFFKKSLFRVFFFFFEESVMFSNETLLEAKAQKSNYKNESKNHHLHFHLIPFRVYFFFLQNIKHCF